MQLQHAGVNGSLCWQWERGCSDSIDAKGKQAITMDVSWLGLFCMAVNKVSNHAHIVGCMRQVVYIVQAFWQKVWVFYGTDMEIQQWSH